MSRSDYIAATRRVVVSGAFLVNLCGCALVMLIIAVRAFGGPAIQALRAGAAWMGQGEVIAWRAGLLGGLALAGLPLLLVVLPLAACDRRYGLRCPQCCRSVTLGCAHGKALRSGRCCHCRAVLFEPADGFSAA